VHARWEGGSAVKVPAHKSHHEKWMQNVAARPKRESLEKSRRAISHLLVCFLRGAFVAAPNRSKDKRMGGDIVQGITAKAMRTDGDVRGGDSNLGGERKLRKTQPPKKVGAACRAGGRFRKKTEIDKWVRDISATPLFKGLWPEAEGVKEFELTEGVCRARNGAGRPQKRKRRDLGNDVEGRKNNKAFNLGQTLTPVAKGCPRKDRIISGKSRKSGVKGGPETRELLLRGGEEVDL